MEIPFDEKWLKQYKGRDKLLVNGYLRANSTLLGADKAQMYGAVTLFYFHHLYMVRS